MSKEQNKCCEKCIWYQMNRCYLNGNCSCHKEPKLPECKHSNEWLRDGNCVLCSKRWNKDSPQKEEPKESFEERTAKKLDNDILDKICEEPKEWEEWTIDNNSPTEKEFKKFISKVESKAKQEVISLCLEKLKDICNKSKTERGLAQALSNYIITLSDKLKGI